MRYHAPFKFDRDLDCRSPGPLLGDNFSGRQPSLAFPPDAGQSRALPDMFGASSVLAGEGLGRRRNPAVRVRLFQ